MELEQVNAIYQMVVEFFVGYSFQIIGASGINLAVRAWLLTSRFHQLRFKLNAAICAALNENCVKIPFPQHEVRMLHD